MSTKTALENYFDNLPIPHFREIYGNDFSHILMRMYGQLRRYLLDGAILIDTTPTETVITFQNGETVETNPLRRPEDYSDPTDYDIIAGARSDNFAALKLILARDMTLSNLVTVQTNTTHEITISLPDD